MDRSDFEYNIKNKLQDYQEDASSVSWRRMFMRLHRSRFYLGLILLAVFVLAGILLFNGGEPEPSAKAKAVPAGKQQVAEAATAVFEYAEDNSTTDIKSSDEISGDVKDKADLPAEKNAPIVQKPYKAEQKTLMDQNKEYPGSELNNQQSFSPQPGGNYGMSTGLITSLEAYSSKLETVHRDSIRNRRGSIYRTDYYAPPESRSRRFELSVEAGPSLSWSGISDEPGYENLIINRKEFEQPLLYASFGLKMSYRIFGKLILRSGLDYSVYGEKQDYSMSWDVYDPESSYFRQDTIWGYIYDPPIYGKPVILGYDSSWVEVYREFNEKRQNNNRYSYFELPLLMGYRFENDKFIIQPNAGVSLGFLNSSAGYIHTGLPGSFEKLETETGLVKQTIWSTLLEFDLAWKLAEGQRIFIKPYYRRTWNSIMENYPLEVRYHQAGLKFGYTICF